MLKSIPVRCTFSGRAIGWVAGQKTRHCTYKDPPAPRPKSESLHQGQYIRSRSPVPQRNTDIAAREKCELSLFSYHRESGKSIGELRLLSAAVGGTRLGTVSGYDPATVPSILLVSFRVSIERRCSCGLRCTTVCFCCAVIRMSSHSSFCKYETHLNLSIDPTSRV
jgi:hypothetical protein